MKYVQYGCGFSAPEGWENFDASPFIWLDRIPIVSRLYTKGQMPFPAAVRYGNIVKGLPVPAGSVTGLYASHVLEHLSRTDLRQALKNSFDMLRPGGTFRLIVPDLKERARVYLAAADANDPAASHHFMESTCLGAERSLPLIKRMIVAGLGLTNHLWMWDQSSMSIELEVAGFSGIRACRLGDSADPAFGAVEEGGRFVDGGIVEVAIECYRPEI